MVDPIRREVLKQRGRGTVMAAARRVFGAN